MRDSGGVGGGGGVARSARTRRARRAAVWRVARNGQCKVPRHNYCLQVNARLVNRMRSMYCPSRYNLHSRPVPETTNSESCPGIHIWTRHPRFCPSVLHSRRTDVIHTYRFGGREHKTSVVQVWRPSSPMTRLRRRSSHGYEAGTRAPRRAIGRRSGHPRASTTSHRSHSRQISPSSLPRLAASAQARMGCTSCALGWSQRAISWQAR